MATVAGDLESDETTNSTSARPLQMAAISTESSAAMNPTSSHGSHSPSSTPSTAAPGAAGTLVKQFETTGGSTLKRTLSVQPPYSVLSAREKWAVVALISAAGLFSPLSANIYFPAIPAISSSLGVSIQQVNLTVTWYMILQGISPTIWGSICDVLGRRPVYLATFSVYIAACIGLGLADVYWLVVVLRCFQAAGSASVIAIGAGSISDIAAPVERGGKMALFSVGPMLGPSIGPVFGGLLAESYSWHAIFWFLASFAGVVLLLLALFLPETLRSIVGNGSIPPPLTNRSLVSLFRTRDHWRQGGGADEEGMVIPKRKGWRDINLLDPIKMFREKDVLLLLTFNSVVYTLFYCVITSTSTSFKTTYHLTETQIGLCFIANGMGCLMASLINGKRMDHDYQVVKRQVERSKMEGTEKGSIQQRDLEGALNCQQPEKTIQKPTDHNDLSQFPIEHARLRSLPAFFFMLIAFTITYGWVLDRGVHLAVPLICQFFIGVAATTIFNSFSTLVVDLYPGRSASATAANNLYRCLMGAAGTAVIEPILNGLGDGWAFTMLSLVTVCFVPLALVEWKYGMRFRAERAVRVKEAAEKVKAHLQEERREEEEGQVQHEQLANGKEKM